MKEIFGNAGYGMRPFEAELREFVLGPGVMVPGILAGDYCPDRRRAYERNRGVAIANATLSSLAGGTTGPVNRLAQGWSRNQRD